MTHESPQQRLSAQELIDRIERLIRVRTGDCVDELKVTVVDGRILLTGRTRTYHSKQLATHAAFSTGTVLPLSNDIQVR